VSPYNNVASEVSFIALAVIRTDQRFGCQLVCWIAGAVRPFR
jgi:hypothetical protein